MDVPSNGAGDACQTETSCRSGLACSTDGLCEPDHSKGRGRSCDIGDECSAGLSCLDGACATAGPNQSGDACGSDRDCAAGLRCAIESIAPVCDVEGTSDIEQPCETNGDCYQGLVCRDRFCEVTQGQTWQGITCPLSTDASPRAYFEVPGAVDAQQGDFFRLPFPNDARRGPHGLNLRGFPTPGTFPFGVDPVQAYVDSITENDTAWGTYPTVTFRFSTEVQVDETNLAWVDVTAGTPEYGNSVDLIFNYVAERGAYVCEHSLSVRPAQGKPLRAGHTYVIWVDRGVRSDEGAPLPSPNFVSLLGDKAPTDSNLQHAHAAYAPFRDYLASSKTDAESILVASVMTTSDPHRMMAALADAVASLPAPTARDWVRCGDGAVSPCPQHDGKRDCGPLDDDYYEYDALVSLPIFQTGTAPYATASEGGNIDPVVQRTEDVCLALTVPRGDMPPTGWPLVIYAHGTGGSYRSHVDKDIAGAWATSAVPTAVLGIDQVEHGPRRGHSDISPDYLFYNFLNPAVARGNSLQGAADQLGLARFAADLSLTADESGGDAIEIDPNAIVFFGHSQGATEGSLMLPYGDSYKAALLSGNGAGLIHALLTKRSPVDVASYIPTLVQDEQLSAFGIFHPVLSLLQQWVDPADPLNFALNAAYEPIDTHLRKHVFQTYGLGDTYAPPVTLATYALAGHFSVVTADASVDVPDRIGMLEAAPPPLVGNVDDGVQRFTLGVREYAPPAGTDGHFVVNKTPGAHDDALRFLNMALAGDVPQIGASE